MEAIALLKNLLHSLPKTVVVGSRAEASFPLDVREKASVAWKSAFHSADYDALNEVSLGEEEYDDRRERNQHRGCHDRAPRMLFQRAGQVAGPLPIVERYSQRLLLIVVQVDHRCEEIVPLTHEREYGNYTQCR